MIKPGHDICGPIVEMILEEQAATGKLRDYVLTTLCGRHRSGTSQRGRLLLLASRFLSSNRMTKHVD